MTRAELDVVLATKGIYIMIGAGEVFLCEVIAQGLCYQLQPTPGYPRDGLLRRDAWSPEKVVAAIGPFARVAA